MNEFCNASKPYIYVQSFTFPVHALMRHLFASSNTSEASLANTLAQHYLIAPHQWSVMREMAIHATLTDEELEEGSIISKSATITLWYIGETVRRGGIRLQEEDKNIANGKASLPFERIAIAVPPLQQKTTPIFNSDGMESKEVEFALQMLFKTNLVADGIGLNFNIGNGFTREQQQQGGLTSYSMYYFLTNNLRRK